MRRTVFFGALVEELLCERRGAAVLPDDGVVDGLAGVAVPDDGGLALVGDAERGDVARANASLAEDLDGGAELRGQDLEGIVLDPAAVGIDLRKLVRCHARNAGRRGRKGWRASWWCPDRAKERTSSSLLVFQQATRPIRASQRCRPCRSSLRLRDFWPAGRGG